MPEMPQDPVNAALLAAEIEPRAVAAWPAREVIPLEGWLLRATNGLTHRGNSVATSAFHGRDLDRAIDRVESEYRARHLAPMFQIADAVEPGGLPERLVARGYEIISPTYVRVASADQMVSVLSAPKDTLLEERASDGFRSLVLEGSRSEADGSERLEILARIAVPLVFVTALVNGQAVSCGTGTNVDGYLGVNLMRTAVEHRRQGHAKRVLAAIAHWAAEQHAKCIYLGVETTNTPAVALYAQAGFMPGYTYRYCRLR